MNRATLAAMGLVLISSLMPGQQPVETRAPIADNPKVELKGKIESIKLSRGQGVPYMDIKAGSANTRVLLGSFRYLMEQDFNPKAGDEVTVKGYQAKDQVVAISVTTQGKVLKLRDDNGWPVWIGGMRGGGMRGGGMRGRGRGRGWQ